LNTILNLHVQVKVVYLKKVTDQHHNEEFVLDLWTRDNSEDWAYSDVPLYVHKPFKVPKYTKLNVVNVPDINFVNFRSSL
jgi:hypothetical protein